MIRIYLDWGVISNLKEIQFEEIKKFISDNKNHLLIPYSTAHIDDLIKSVKPDNEQCQLDLDTLDFLSENHFLRYNGKVVEGLNLNSSKYFNSEKNKKDIFTEMDILKLTKDMGGFGTIFQYLFESLPLGFSIDNENRDLLKVMFPTLTEKSTFWDLLKNIAPFSKKLSYDKEYFKDFRKNIQEKGLKLETNSGNWSSEEVLLNIDKMLAIHDKDFTFLNFVDLTFKHRKSPPNRFEYFISAYLLLDLLGYKADKLPKPTNNMTNIQIDAQHSFYAAYCDYFIVEDRNLAAKTKVIYKQLNIPTKVISINDFIFELKGVSHDNSRINIDIIFKNFKKENLIDKYCNNQQNCYTSYTYKLPIFYFNFFNRSELVVFEENQIIVIEFYKEYENYSNFTYNTELNNLIDMICGSFGCPDDSNFEVKKHEFIYGELEVLFEWRTEFGLVHLKMEDGYDLPKLIYILKFE